MNFKMNWKRFWTVSGSREGFTLVELIVVIAILAILAGVAVPAYSGYVKKANMQADMTLASEVAHALTLYYYSHPNEVTSGYVVLTTSGASGDGVVSDAAMAAVFGDSWAETAVLKYDGWTNNGWFGTVADYSDDDLKNIVGSSFMTASSPEGLMTAVTDMTGLVSEVIAGSDLSKATERLNSLLGADSHVVTTLNNLNLDPNAPEYSTVVSNLLVTEMADILQTGDGTDNLSALMGLYTSMYAYAETTGDSSVLDQFASNLDTISFETLNSDQCIDYCFTGLEETEGWSRYQEFAQGEQEVTDKNALNAMMGAVGKISSSYTDLKSLSDGNLYTSGAVAEQVNNYVNSVKAMAGMDADTRTALAETEAGAITVFIAEDGSISVVPDAAWLVS